MPLFDYLHYTRFSRKSQQFFSCFIAQFVKNVSCLNDFPALYSAVKYENACTILQTRLKKPHNFKQSRNCVAFWKTWRRVWDSNPRALSDNCISSAARYDHFDNSPNQCIRIVKSNDDTTLCIISHFTNKSKLFLKLYLCTNFISMFWWKLSHLLYFH